MLYFDDYFDVLRFGLFFGVNYNDSLHLMLDSFFFRKTEINAIRT